VGRRARGQSAPTEPLDGAGPEPGGPLSSAEMLETSPFEGDLEEQLKAVPPSSLKPGLTLYLGAAVLVVAGFVGGIQADKQWGGNKSSANSAFPGAANRQGAGGTGRYLGGGGGFPGAGGTGNQSPGTTPGGAQSGAGGNATTGTVKMVDGSTVYVTTPNGIVAVKTNGTTKIRIMKNGKVQDLAPGSTVVVQGAPGSDGSVTASAITEGGTRTGGG
jgi:hypothetical protein